MSPWITAALAGVCAIMLFLIYAVRVKSCLAFSFYFAALMGALGLAAWGFFKIKPYFPALSPGAPWMILIGVIAALFFLELIINRGFFGEAVFSYAVFLTALFLAALILTKIKHGITIGPSLIGFAAVWLLWWLFSIYRPIKAALYRGAAWASMIIYLLLLLFLYERISPMQPALILAGLFLIMALFITITRIEPLKSAVIVARKIFRTALRPYLVRRILIIIPTLFGITIIIFFLGKLTPGDPALLKVKQMQGGGGLSQPITPEMIEQFRKIYGWDKPLPVQYRNWFKRAVKLDFGDSIKYNKPVWDKIKEALPRTMLLSFLSIILAYIIAVPVGIFSATHHNTLVDRAMTILLFALYSLPSFFAAMLLLNFLGGGEHLNVFPIGGFMSMNYELMPWWAKIFDKLWHCILPVICLTYGELAYLSRYQRGAMLEVIRQDYIQTARAKGLPESVVIYKHALRNALIPIITLLGYLLPELIAGAVIIEQIFSFPGMGMLGFEAILNRDLPLVMGILTISAFLTLIGILISDILYSIVDPRIRFD